MELCDRIVAAATDVGIKLILLIMLYQHVGLERLAFGGGQRRFGNMLGSFAELDATASRLVQLGLDDFSVAVARHVLRIMDTTVLDLALHLVCVAPAHMHLAEQVAEVT